MGNSECGIKRGGRESSSTKDFQGRAPNTICYRKLLRLFILWIIPKSCGAEGVEGGERKAPGNPDGTLVNALLYHCAIWQPCSHI